jgi:uroporphyrinogen decarboxylase
MRSGPGVTPDEVRTEVRRRIDEMAGGGGYIASPSHSVPYEPEILAAMYEEIDAYGHHYYRTKDTRAERRV